MTAAHCPSPDTATDELPSPSPMEATAQLSPAAGAGTATSQSREVAAMSRTMRDPYTPGIMFPAAPRHAEGEADSPDGGDIRRFAFAAGETFSVIR
ncbi:hypothetical protein ACFW9O_30170 [Streptomyces sp. NPDC059499]|uniref:hypothetical protein n=1 Tax=Streptomyces sp. NPDC059499 TaxID=3346852 RepID=UPI0036984309